MCQTKAVCMEGGIANVCMQNDSLISKVNIFFGDKLKYITEEKLK